MIKRKFEAALIMVAAKILDRNVSRSSVTSRRDNNELFEIEFKLREISQRVSSGYGDV